ncbi:MAG: RpiB/LacA/LacB family sugar-phosphate isomerase [Clostridia bacterium]|nr:RpiB/LacA/LacB family sugar-phosphate isomerase [Clostridia bacterium]
MDYNKIALGCDHVGFQMKEQIRAYLISRGMEVVIDPVKDEASGNGTFLETADAMCGGIQEDKCRLGIFICGTGLGFSTVANTYWGIRAAHASDPYTAKMARLSLNAQILCLGCRVVGFEYAKMIIDAFLEKPFDWSRKSSVENLRLMEKAQLQRAAKPENIAWSMGFHPDES